ncbi:MULTISPECIES: nucleotidyltransferase [unclassified Pantoea]|uniref:nucleotidyltransferase domain-containing protein n=1 Tax=unclassified Pantoea TaxID=2630326 RepID=UPI001231FA73|nr:MULTISPECIES: nucleotidyltransferase [unclassified Pantoea]KAA6099012.1 nucleotidyltransferase [Pantoea sp. B_9]KAA6115234.1 nucleotidyltransferase [Pantoea sp. B_10]
MSSQVLDYTAQDSSQVNSWEKMLIEASKKISLTSIQYDLIESRYSQLQKILDKAQEFCLSGAHIFIQGSIGLKTTVKPAPEAKGDMATIDADAIILLPNAVNSKPEDVLLAIETLFRAESTVKADPQQLRRGIRIVYSDENPGFHIDITPAIIAPGNYESEGYGKLLVPDRQDGWKASAPRSYSLWLENVSTKKILMITESTRTIDSIVGNEELAKSTMDPIPNYQEYSDSHPLGATIKLLKRHRDRWAIRASREIHRPISAVITTLATKAYYQIALRSALTPMRPIDVMFSIVSDMAQHVDYSNSEYKVLNPCDEGENFAEKWNRDNGEGDKYRDAFYDWHADAITDIALGLSDWGTQQRFEQEVSDKFGVPQSMISEISKDFGTSWTLPGRTSGVTLNKNVLSAFGTLSGLGQANAGTVERLG